LTFKTFRNDHDLPVQTFSGDEPPTFGFDVAEAKEKMSKRNNASLVL
jgi:hypothetical protein